MASVTMTALGDSVTAGIGDVGHVQGWAAHLAEALGVDSFHNVARVGARARDVAELQLPVAVQERPSIATLLVGGNDVLRGDFDAGEVGFRVRQTVRTLTTQGTDCLVVLLHDPRSLAVGPRSVREVLARRAQLTNDAIRLALKDVRRVCILDPRHMPESGQARAWHIDRMHPSAWGHRFLASRAVDALAQLGWSPRRDVSLVVPPGPGVVAQAVWLMRYGTPWAARRSTDLLPDLAAVWWRERHLPSTNQWP